MTIWVSPSQPRDWWTDDEVEDGFAPQDARPVETTEAGEEILAAMEKFQRLIADDLIRRAFDRE